MEDMQTIIILLSVIVGLLSIVILALLGLIIGLLVKLGAIMKRIDTITTNVASATEWFSPIKVFKEIGKLFHKN